MTTWKEDRNRLRDIIRTTKPEGDEATLLYCLVAQMRGKKHMDFYDKYHGGWRPFSKKTKYDYTYSKEFYGAYGPGAAFYYGQCILVDLEDQAEWISIHLDKVASDEVKEIADRVLGDWNGEDIYEKGLVKHDDDWEENIYT